MQFHKYQALGNDFIVIRESELRTVTTNYGEFAQRICDRHFGAGADGLEVVLDRKTVDDADFEIRLYNADGGETPISGNGTRCVAAYVCVAERWIKPRMRIATAAGVKALSLIDRKAVIAFLKWKSARPNLPVLKFRSTLIPLEKVIRQSLHIDEQEIEFTRLRWAIRIAAFSWMTSRTLTGAGLAQRLKCIPCFQTAQRRVCARHQPQRN